jgi:hypothetical protein
MFEVGVGRTVSEDVMTLEAALGVIRDEFPFSGLSCNEPVLRPFDCELAPSTIYDALLLAVP